MSDSHPRRIAPAGRFALGFVAAALAASAGAQNTPATPAPAATAEGSPDKADAQTVFVTANRRKERAQDVAGAVNAIGGAKLEALGITGLADFASYVPGLAIIGDRPGYQQQAIRGITTGFLQSSATVGTYIDDTPVSFNSNFSAGSLLSPDPDPLDLDRIEVLKGPQGSLYGASALGGLIKYVTVQPDLKNLEGKVEFGLSKVSGGGNGHALRGAINVPVMPGVLALRASAYDREEPGFFDNIASGRNDINSMHIRGGRLSALLKPNGTFNARLTTETQTIRIDDAAVAQADPITLSPSNGDYLKVNWKLPTPSKNDNSRTNLTLNYDAGFATLLSSSSTARNKTGLSYDYTNNFGPSFAVPVGGDTAAYHINYDNKKDTQEFRLTSPGGQTLDWLLGVFYTKETIAANGALDVLKGPAGGPFTVIFPNALNLAFFGATLKDTSIYANGTYRISDAFDVQIGVRRASIRQTYTQQGWTVFGGPYGVDGTAPSDESHTTWMLSPRWKLDRDTMVYLRAATGYRPGGPNFFVPSSLNQFFGSDKLLNTEVGIKGALPASGLDYTATLFNIDWKDIQVNGLSTSGFSFYANGGKAHSRGLELEASWRPATALKLTGNLALTDAKLDEDIAVTGVNARKGERIPYVSPLAFALTADYTSTLWAGVSATYGASMRHVGQRDSYFASQTTALTNAHIGKLPAYDLVDLRAAFSKDIWTLSLSVKNLFDKRGIMSANGTMVGAGSAPGTYTPVPLAIVQPRTFGVTLRADF